jgi:hypothetical protein
MAEMNVGGGAPVSTVGTSVRALRRTERHGGIPLVRTKPFDKVELVAKIKGVLT